MTAPMTRRTGGVEAARLATRVDALERRFYDLAGFFCCKVYPDPLSQVGILVPELTVIQTGDSQFHFAVERSITAMKLVEAEASLGAAGSSDVIVQIRNSGTDGLGGVNMLTDPIQIDAGDLSSFFSAAPSEVDTANDEVDLGEIIWIDVDADAGGDETGLNVMLRFE